VTPRVLHVLEALEGGTARHLVDVVRNARATEHEVVVPERRVGGLTDELAVGRLQDAGATVHHLSMRRTPWAPGNASALVQLRRLLAKRSPAVIHGHSSIGGLLARSAATGTHTPRAYTPNGITQVRAGIAVERSLRRLTDRFVAVSLSEGDLAVQLGLIDRNRLAVIPNGIELEPAPLVDLRAQLGIAESTPLVGTIARLVPQKAPEDFVAACAVVAKAVPEARFVLIGGGQLEAEFDALVRTTGLGDRFTRIGALPGAAGALAQLDVFALSSRFEGGPYAPLEAMRAGTAVVLTDVVGSRDAVEHDRSGVLVPVGDPEALGAAVAELLLDTPRREQLAAAGRERVLAHFDVRSMGSQLDSLYAELSDGRRRVPGGS
jgi:glycosyltransferase involved in cell wall biosynthesis